MTPTNKFKEGDEVYFLRLGQYNIVTISRGIVYLTPSIVKDIKIGSYHINLFEWDWSKHKFSASAEEHHIFESFEDITEKHIKAFIFFCIRELELDAETIKSQAENDKYEPSTPHGKERKKYWDDAIADNRKSIERLRDQIDDMNNQED